MHKLWPPLTIVGSLLAIALMFSGSQAAAVTYYVSPSGNDKNAGTLASPWLTLQKAANTVTAGNTVIVLPGTYNERVIFGTKPNHSGTNNDPVIFKSQTPLAAIINGGFDTRNADYVVIDGFKITTTSKGSTGGGVLIGSNNITVKNNYFYDIPDAGVRGYNSSKFSTNNAVIEDNQFIGNHFGLIAVGDNWQVEDNEITLKRWVTGDMDYIRFAGSNNIFRHNYLHGTSLADKGTAIVDGWQASSGSGKTFVNTEISGNIVESFDEAVSLSSASLGGFDNISIFNNVFNSLFSEGDTAGGYGVYAKKNITNLDIKHNTFANFTTAAVRVNSQSVATVQNNIFFNASNNYYLTSKGVITGGHNLLGATTKNTFKDNTDLTNTDPLFINSDNILGADGLPWTADDGFNLKEGSLAINEALFSSVADDIRGVIRPQGPTADIGAYETSYISIDTTPPLTTAIPSGGVYSSGQTVFLQTDESAQTYYCLDQPFAATSCSPNTLYNSAIAINSSKTLRFYSVDVDGNEELVNQEFYTINTDTTPPITTVYPPAGAYPLDTSISFLRNEPGLTFYCQTASCTPTLPYTAALSLTEPLTLRFYSVDDAGNNEAVKESGYTLTSLNNATTTSTSTSSTSSTSNSSATSTDEVVDGNSSTLSGTSGGSTSGGGGGSVKISTTTATTSSATVGGGDSAPDLTNLKLQVVELQKTLINLLQQLIQKGRTVSEVAAESLAAVGSLFLLGFKL